jgi:hypothetical protein
MSLLKKVKKIKNIFVDMLLRRYDTRQYTMNEDYTFVSALANGIYCRVAKLIPNRQFREVKTSEY